MKLFLLLALLLPLNLHAKLASKNKFFFQGMIGASVLGENQDTPDSIDDEQEVSAGTAGTFNLGYRWGIFSIELTGAHLGNPSHEVGKTYEEEHSPLFIGGGLHWTFNFFDVKLGWGSVRDKISFKKMKESNATFSASPNNKSETHRAGYFGLGINFDLSKSTQFVLDYTAYAWQDEKEQNFVINGTAESNEGTDYAVGVIGLGLRFFF